MNNEFTLGEISAYYTARVPKLNQRRAREWRGPCPIHDGKGHNFAVDPATGKWFCHSVCGRGGDIFTLEETLAGGTFPARKAEVFRLVGRMEPEHRKNGTSSGSRKRRKPSKTSRDAGINTADAAQQTEETVLAAVVRGNLAQVGYQPVAEFQYSERLRKVRFEHESRQQDGKERAEKTFRWEHLGDDVWYSGDGGIPKPLYVNRRFRERDQVGLAVGFEGEGKADIAGEFGLPAFSFKNITSEQAAALVDCEVVLWPDNDESGKQQAEHAGRLIAETGHARNVGLLTPPPELPPAADVIDAVRDFAWDGPQILKFLKTASPYSLETVQASARSLGGGCANKFTTTGSPERSDPWRKPEAIRCDLPPVESFSPDLVPISFRALVTDIAERMQVPPDYPATVIVLCLAGAVNRRATIQPKANDSSWLVVPNLWGGIIAPPGFMKSPVIQACTSPLLRIQAEWHWEHEAALADYAREKEECELRQAAWRDLFKASAKVKRAAPERPGDGPLGPRLKRLIVNDATFEAMHETMSENPAGILVIRDELTGWWSALDRAGREGERGFCLQAWNGDTGHTIDRIGRGTIHVPACCMSMLGGIQPGRLRSYMVDALKDGPSNDGLIQRFQLLVWPNTGTDWTYVDRPPDAAAQEQASRVFRRILEVDVDNQLRLRFASDAQGLFVDWLTNLEKKIRTDEHPALISHLSKYRKLMPALALIFELADRAALGFLNADHGQADAAGNLSVSVEHTRQAAAWCDYLESHARRIYSCITTPQKRAAQVLADKIKKRKVGADGFFSCREVYLKNWSGLDTPELVNLATEVLQDAGWIRYVNGQSGPLGGRPANVYQVNPRLWA